MLKALLVISLIPLIAALALRLLFYKKGQHLKGKKAQLTTLKLFRELSGQDIVIETSTKLKVNHGQLSLPPTLAESKELPLQIEALIPLSLLLLGKGKASAYKQHSSLLRFDVLFSSFGFITVLFGLLAKTIPISLGVVLFALILGLTSLNNLYLTWLRHQAILLLISKIKRLPLYVKQEDYALLVQQLKVNTYKHTVPKLLSWIL